MPEAAQQGQGSAPAQTNQIVNPLIDYNGFLTNAAEVGRVRSTRRLTEEQFVQMARQPGTIVFDARSDDKYEKLHIKGAKHLSFPEITAEQLARVIPDKSMRILIYCNNNFLNAPNTFASKVAVASLNIHTFNTLLEGQQQVILTCDRYPKEVDGLEERLKSRFGWGLTVAIEPPELETCVAILMSKATSAQVELPEEVAFFIAKRIRSNVRELEGALRRVVANSHFTGRPITLDFAREALRDLLALQDKLVTVENIQKTVAEYYKIRVADLLSKRRSRSIARPRQVAMALAKELTSHSLPEIGDAFGGRDHTTVLHACKRIKELRESETRVGEDYSNLLRTLAG